MDKLEHTNWWKDEADRTWKTALYNKAGNQNIFALFAFHLSIEKLMKAAWIKDNVDNFTPRSHDLKLLYNESDLSFDNGWYDYLGIINEWNIESKYPDYKLKIYKIADNEYIEFHLQKLSELRQLLLNYIA